MKDKTMNIIDTAIPDVKLLEPQVFGDARGFFYGNLPRRVVQDPVCNRTFVQETIPNPAKAYCAACTIKPKTHKANSCAWLSAKYSTWPSICVKTPPTFGKWVGEILSAENKRQLWIPEGFAHGFYVLSDEAEFVYKCTDYYNPKAEHSLIWNDPTVGIDWPLQGEPNLSPKDLAGKVLAEAVTF